MGGTQRWVAGTESITNSSVPGSPGKKTSRLTLNNHILASLLVLLAATTDFVGKAIALMTEGLATLAHWIAIHSVALDEHRLVGDVGRDSEAHIYENLPPRHITRIVAHAPLSSTCSMSLACQTLGRSRFGVGRST